MTQYGNSQRMRTITLEEHYASSAFLEGSAGRDVKARYNNLIKQLCDIGEYRIADMDKVGIDVQVLSLTSPGLQQLDASEAVALAREENDRLAEAVRRYPNRFAGFAALPTSAPEAAAGELERTISQHGFKGALINGHTQGRYLDDTFFWPILERAEALHVPIYLHPTPPPQPVLDTYYGGFAPQITAALSTGGWGWHIETAIHIIRLILGGVFDRYPNLQLVIGHMGEALPFMMSRIDAALPMTTTKLDRPLAAYFRENLHYTFGGFNWTPTFLDLLLQVGVDRIMFSADYPYQSMERARTFLDQLPVSPADKERIAHGNAERLLRL
jgi:predicted TIM-barrel fold metal-dependent hydrolase